MQRNILVTILVILIFCSVATADLEFFKEELDFELREDSFLVCGDYYFRNTSDKNLAATLFYPIPRDSSWGFYDSPEVFTSSKNTDSLLMSARENGFGFKISIKANSTKKYTIKYKQPLFRNKARYILTSSNSWGKPLEEAFFQLRFPKTITIDSLSILPDSLTENQNSYFLYWNKREFMPVKDFIILYHK